MVCFQFCKQKYMKGLSMMEKYNIQHSLQDDSTLNAELPSEISF